MGHQNVRRYMEMVMNLILVAIFAHWTLSAYLLKLNGNEAVRRGRRNMRRYMEMVRKLIEAK